MEANTQSPFISYITTQFTLFTLTSILPSIILAGQISYTLSLPFLLYCHYSSVSFFPRWKNSMDCFVWSLCHVLHYLRDYLYLFSFFPMWKLHYSPLSDSLVTPFYVCSPPLLSITPLLIINFIFSSWTSLLMWIYEILPPNILISKMLYLMLL